MKIIDMWAPLLPTKPYLDYIEKSFPLQMLGYLRIFHHKEVDESSVGEFVAGMRAGGEMQLDQIVKVMDMSGIEQMLITGFDELTSCGRTFVPNRIVADIYKE